MSGLSFKGVSGHPSFKVASPVAGARRPLFAVRVPSPAQQELDGSPGVNYHPPCLIFTTFFFFLPLSDSLRVVATWRFLRRALAAHPTSLFSSWFHIFVPRD